MIGYGELTWTNMSGSGTWPLIAIAPQRHHTSVYVAAEADGRPLVQVFDVDLGRVQRGKQCIRFTRFATLQPGGWRDLVHCAVEAATVQDSISGRNCAVPVEGTVQA